METSRAKLASEIIGVILIALAVLTIISLASYNPSDPSFNSYLSGSAKAQNNAGIIGACIADILVQTAGAAAWLAPLGLLYIGILFCYGPRPAVLISFLAGYAVLSITVSSLVNIQWQGDPIFAKALSGGVMGQFVAKNLMVRWLSVYGSYVVLAALALSSILLITRMSVSSATGKVFRFSLVMKGYGAVTGSWTFRQLKKLGSITIPIFMETDDSEPVKRRRIRPRSAHAPIAIDTGMDEPEIDDNAFIPVEPAIINIDLDNIPPLPPGRNVASLEEDEKAAGEFQQALFNFGGEEGDYVFPSVKLLDTGSSSVSRQSKEDLIKRSMILEKKLLDFGIEGRITQVLPGPVITVYEFEPAPGIKVSKITGLADDLAMVLRAVSVRILAPVPGKSVVGIEVPNPERETVFLQEIINSPEFRDYESKLTMALGKDVSGAPVTTDLAQVPHLLIAGSTGSGKSVGINAMISSILFKATPAEVKFIMIDPKMLELSIYEGIPHLIAPVVTNPKKAANALRWAVEEMERRYEKLSAAGVRNIASYNAQMDKKIKEAAKNSRAVKTVRQLEEEAETPVLEKVPFIVVVIDELADLMMVASKEVEDSLARLAQMARAAGIHLIVATQRPSVDVLTGLIKANFPARISYQVRSRIDSRTILDSMGAEKLLGKGDMLLLPPGSSKIQRIHGPFVSDEEIHRVVDFLKDQQQPVYDENILETPAGGADPGMDGGFDEEADEFYDRAVELVATSRQASISMIQRRFRIGYNRAARIVEMMEAQGLVGPSEGLKPREVFLRELDDVETVN